MDKKLIILFAIVALGCGLLGGAVGALLIPSSVIEAIAPQWVSRLHFLFVDGNADVTIARFQGHITQTSDILQVQQSDATVVFSVTNEGTTMISGTLTISDALALAGSITVVNVDASGYVSATGNITSATVIYGTGLDAGDADVDNVADIALDTISADDGSSFVISDDWTNAGNTVADLGTVTTVDINGGTIDGVVVGGSSALAGTFTTLVVTSTSDLRGNVANSTGDLTIADDVDITLGLDVQGGAIVLQNDEEIQNDVNGTITLHIAGADEWDFTADQLDATNGQIVNIGAAGTDFSGTGGLTLADDLVATGAITSTAGVLALQETTTPVSVTNYGRVYTKTDNNLYFQDGAGTEHTLLQGLLGTQHDFFAALEDPTGVVGNWDIVEINAAQAVHFSGQIPEDFEVLDAATIVMIPDTTETIQWDINVSIAGVGEAYNNDDRSAVNQTLAVTATQLTEVDISGLFTGLSAGDYFAIDFQSDTANLRIVGFEFDWN